MPNKLLAATLVTAALAAGCRREELPPAPPAEPHAALPTPVRMVVNPLAAATSGYTNDMQIAHLQQEASAQGIKRFTQAVTVGADETHNVAAPSSFEEGLERTRALTHSLAVQRHGIDLGAGKEDSVPLVGDTPQIIPPPNGDTGGSAIVTPSVAPAPKSP